MDPEGRLRRPLEWTKHRAPSAYRFLTTDQKGPRIAREVLSVVLVVGLVLSSIYIYAGQGFDQPPVVVVESGSMMHCANGRGAQFQGNACDSSSFGRLGTIDPGDVIIVRDIDSRDDVETYAEHGEQRYGTPGDVIVYRPGGNPAVTPVIHRALFWFEILPNGNFSIPALGIHDQWEVPSPEILARGGVPQADLQGGFLENFRQDCAGVEPGHSDPSHPSHEIRPVQGFITSGDNNQGVDQRQITGSYCPVQTEWIIGKARGEIPWIGMLKLFVTDRAHYQQAPTDIKQFMWASLGLVLFGPFLVDLTLQGIRKARDKDGDTTQEQIDPAEAHDDPEGDDVDAMHRDPPARPPSD